MKILGISFSAAPDAKVYHYLCDPKSAQAPRRGEALKVCVGVDRFGPKYSIMRIRSISEMERLPLIVTSSIVIRPDGDATVERLRPETIVFLRTKGDGSKPKAKAPTPTKDVEHYKNVEEWLAAWKAATYKLMEMM